MPENVQFSSQRWQEYSFVIKCICTRAYVVNAQHLDRIVTCLSVTVDGVRIGNRIYCILTTRYYISQITHGLLLSVCTSRCLVEASNCGRSLSSGFPNNPGLSHELLRTVLHRDWVTDSTQSQLYYDRQSAIWDPRPNFLLLSLIIFRQLGSDDVGCPLWLEVGSVVFSCCWTSPA
jgi:hypothetical protein